MKKNLWISVKLTLVLLLLCSVLYPLMISLAAKAAPGDGDGQKVIENGRVVGYANIGQKFSEDKYFWGRPSAVNYNASGSAGSNKGPSNPDYLKIVQDRIDTFRAHNPGVAKLQIPSEMVTASGSGLDPNISPPSAYLQVARIGRTRKISETWLKRLIAQNTEKHLLGPDVINVLKLNVALDNLNRNPASGLPQ